MEGNQPQDIDYCSPPPTAAPSAAPLTAAPADAGGTISPTAIPIINISVNSWDEIVTNKFIVSAYTGDPQNHVTVNVILAPSFVMGSYTGECDFSGRALAVHCNNQTLDAGEGGRFFNGDGELTLHGCRLIRGKAGSGSAIRLVNGGSLVIRDSILERNGENAGGAWVSDFFFYM
jgi:hypothetical protein